MFFTIVLNDNPYIASEVRYKEKHLKYCRHKFAPGGFHHGWPIDQSTVRPFLQIFSTSVKT